MNGENKYLNLKGDLKYNIDVFRKSLKNRARAAKYSFLIVTVVFLLLLLVSTSDKVEILLFWTCAMLVISAYIVLLEYFEKVWLDGLEEVSDKYDYYGEEEYECEDGEEAFAAEEKVVAEH